MDFPKPWSGLRRLMTHACMYSGVVAAVVATAGAASVELWTCVNGQSSAHTGSTRRDDQSAREYRPHLDARRGVFTDDARFTALDTSAHNLKLDERGSYLNLGLLDMPVLKLRDQGSPTDAVRHHQHPP